MTKKLKHYANGVYEVVGTDAVKVDIADTSNKFAGTNVETALQEVATRIDTTNANLSALLPAGIITMWSGALNAIPAGWKLCDGANGTPDLRNKFVVGAGSAYVVGATGGADTTTVPAHAHSYSGNTSGPSATVNNASGAGNYFPTTNHTHTYSGNTSTQGATTLDNRPPYFAIAYIMKVNGYSFS